MIPQANLYIIERKKTMTFTAKEFRKIARTKLRGNWGRSILVSFIAAVICGLGGIYETISKLASLDVEALIAGDAEALIAQYESLDGAMTGSPILALIVGIAVILLTGAITQGCNRYYTNLTLNGKADEVSVLFSRFDIFLKTVGLELFMTLFTFLWGLLFVIPGIVATYRYRLAHYLMAENPELGIRQAVNMSKELMKGHKWRLFCLDLSFIGWGILASLTCGIGYLWLNPYMDAASAAFYIDRTGRGIPMGDA